MIRNSCLFSLTSKIASSVFFILISLFLVSASVCTVVVEPFLLKTSLGSDSFAQKVARLTSDATGLFEISTNVPGIIVDKEIYLVNGVPSSLDVSFNSSDLQPGAYVGSLFVNNSQGGLAVPVIFEVNTPDVLYGISLEVPPFYSDVHPGESLVYQASVINLFSQDMLPEELTLEYIIYDFNGTKISSTEDSVMVQDIARLTGSFPLPKSFICQDYVLVAIAKSGSSVSVSSRVFTVSPSNKKPLQVSLIFATSFVLVFLIVLYFFVRNKFT